jgi:hypothetical protein
MLRQAQANYFDRKSAQCIRLGPLQRLKLIIPQPFIRKGSPLRVPPKPLWFEKGWRQTTEANQYTGQFKAAGRSWQGLIQQPYPGSYTAYIWQPPLAEIRRNTSHGPCFMANGEAGRYQVHFHSIPSCLDHAIDNIERVLAQACTGSVT